MLYYGFTEEQHEKVITLLNKISVTGIVQIDAFHEATTILRKPVGINYEPKEANPDGEEVH